MYPLLHTFVLYREKYYSFHFTSNFFPEQKASSQLKSFCRTNLAGSRSCLEASGPLCLQKFIRVDKESQLDASCCHWKDWDLAWKKRPCFLQTRNYSFHLHLFTLEKPRNDNTINFIILLLPIACGIIIQPVVSILMPFFKTAMHQITLYSDILIKKYLTGMSLPNHCSKTALKNYLTNSQVCQSPDFIVGIRMLVAFLKYQVVQDLWAEG